VEGRGHRGGEGELGEGERIEMEDKEGEEERMMCGTHTSVCLERES
jgi:hypothetical protein